MCAVLIYPDTTVWNALCDQSADAKKLTNDLGCHQGHLVLGTNAVYEMAKTFKGSRLSARQRGQQLFSYMKKYVEVNIPLLRQADEILSSEARHVRKENTNVELWYESANYDRFIEEVDKLANGVFDPRAAQFIPLREAQAKQSRDDLYAHIEERPLLKQKLARIPKESVGPWIAREIKHSARRILTGHLAQKINGL